MQRPIPVKLVLVLTFLCSGFAALSYQTYFAKKLALVFGSQSSAAYTVLAIYMAGMALGSALGAALAHRTRRPLYWYGAAEAVIAAYCWITPDIFGLAHVAYVDLAQGIRPDAGQLALYQVLLGAAVLALPTILMGVTLPLLVRAAAGVQECFAALSALYSANTLGAAFGALCAGYWLIPGLGMRATLGVSCLIDLGVALIAVWLAARIGGALPDAASPAAPRQFGPARLRNLALVILFFTGAITMLLEVSAIHLLAVVIGNSVYAFALMVTCFLLGLGLGGYCARAVAGRDETKRLMRGTFVLAACILSSTFLWQAASAYFFWLAGLNIPNSFALREFLRVVPALCIMLPPAFAIGALYPLTMSMAADGRHDSIGIPGALNTVGNIVGVLAAGFVLLPAIGGMGIALVAAALAIGMLALALFAMPAPGMRRFMPLAALLLLFAVVPKSLDWSRVASGVNVYMRIPYYASGSVIDHAESADGGLTAIFGQKFDGEPLLHKTLTTNGKFEGNNVMARGGEMEAQVGLGLAPLMHVSHLDDALVIGYGAGITSMTIHESGFERMDIVDLSRDLVRLSDRHFDTVNFGVSSQPNVHMYYTDGRNYLSLTDRKYDLIAMQLSSIWFAGAASLYNREFYATAAAHLKQDGVLQQWVQLHHTTPRDLQAIYASAAQSFDHVWMYVIGGQGVLIASNSVHAAPDDIKRQRVREAAAKPRLRPFVALFNDGIDAVLDGEVLSPDAVARWVSSKDAIVSTDDNLYLEYSTPKGNALPGEVADTNLTYLQALQ
ncbi:MAG TPA: fused MFS/spermidine synthase [Burkholderiaceae bacterium]|jgi:spermidine synthase